jgi:hypothetical protein
MDSDENCAAEKSDCAYQQAIGTLEENKKQYKTKIYNTINGRKSKPICKSR